MMTEPGILFGRECHEPIERCKLLSKALSSYCDGNDWKSIYYESKALCFSFFRSYKPESTYHGTRPSHFTNKSFRLSEIARFIGKNHKNTLFEEDNKLDEAISSSPFMSQIIENSLIDDVSDNMSNTKLEPTVSPSKDMDEDRAINDLKNWCAALPKEWTVVQICKMNDEYNGLTNQFRHFTSLKPIKFTLPCYTRSDWMNGEPLCCHLDFEDTSYLKLVYSLYFKTFKDVFTSGIATQESVGDISIEIAKVIEMLKIWMGPWIVLFSGKVRGKKGIELEKKIEMKVQKFCAENGLTHKRSKILLLLVARRIDLVDTDGISRVATSIGTNLTKINAVKKFLSVHKLGFDNTGIKYYPCILVLDEMLDTIPWEMLIPTQEATRFNSIYMLFDLYKEYKDQISDGYLRIAVNTGNALINPTLDDKLAAMSKRMVDFLKYWVPDWKLTEGKTPSDIEMNELLSTADVYSFSGHSSSLQYFPYKAMKRLKTKSVLLLFGCESVAIQLPGAHYEPAVPHMYLHAAKCPTILGATTIVTDLWVDMITIYLLSQWIPSSKSKLWTPAHVNKSKTQTERVQQIMGTLKGTHEPSLLAILSKIRSETLFGIRHRAVMVCRGLPVINTLAKTDKLLK